MGAGPGLSITPVSLFANVVTWTDMPAAATEFSGVPAYRRRWHTEGYTQVRSHAYVPTGGVGGAVLQAQYTTDLTGATAWENLCANTLPVDVAGGIVTAWETIPAGARDKDVLLRFIGSGGDGSADPQIANVQIDFR